MDECYEIFDECYSSARNTSSVILKYFIKYSEFEKKGLENMDPYIYAKLACQAMFIYRLLEKEIGLQNLTKDERNAVMVMRRYKQMEVSDPSPKNYVKFSLWKNSEGTLKYKISDYQQDLKSEDGFEKLYAYLIPHPEIMHVIKEVFLKVALSKGIIEL
ncbi:conserved hypothetical protein [Methanococcus vannielii SB]|uniref:Uncharacterized protein n=1 Tax=Methanococcus vannielii (strain ATCC 35089 / DSM 1224 / JCM 13029 / OCM 148 / SB) TaxID=406327 RepID=A6UNJ5_METVS|nr:hypothetical protein [Methanococcus vannielii]ABR54067.1 conserved hypothetical protein [Methanococcus vannielii SB]